MKYISKELTRWWTDPWWLDDQYASAYRESISVEQVNECVLAVSRVFNEAWLNATRPHRAAYWLVSKGLDPLHFLIALGKDILATKGARGFREVVRDLRSPDNYESARLELSLAALMREEGYGIQFHPKLPNGKSSDLLTTFDDEEVFFEVKILRASVIDDLLSDFTTWLGIIVDELVAQHGDCFADKSSSIILEPHIADVFDSKSRLNREFHKEFAAQTKEEILRHLRAGDQDFYIPNVGTFAFRPKDVLANSTIAHHPVSSNVELGRILRGRLHGIVHQLPFDRPGIVVFRTPGDLDPSISQQAIQGSLDSLGSEGTHVSAAIILPVTYSFPQRWSRFKGFVVKNPRARTAVTSLCAYRTLISACGLDEQTD